MHVYLDHNFLISCTEREEWQRALLARPSKVILVLSPWHFYEIGRGSQGRREKLLNLLDELKPSWCLERGDLELWEFEHRWQQFLGKPLKKNKLPIAPMHIVAAALHRVHPKRLINATIRDYVDVFAGDVANVLNEMGNQKGVAATVRDHYKQGKMTPQINRLIDLRYIAVQCARSQGLRIPEQIHRRVDELLVHGSHSEIIIQIFVDSGCLKDMKAYQVESLMAEQMYGGEAALDPNRFVDRQHAIMGLSYCDVLITDDRDLTKRCNDIRTQLTFASATVTTGQEFIDSLT